MDVKPCAHYCGNSDCLYGRCVAYEKQNADLRPKPNDDIAGWKQWHRELTAALGLTYVERNATLNAVKELVAKQAAAGEVGRG